MAAAVQSPDSATDTINTQQLIGDAIAALASFQAAAGLTPALVKAGAAIVGTNSAVNPTFGQATAAGHLLVAWVTAVGSDPTTATAGWSQVVEATGFGQAGRVAIWIKPNSAGGDAAPQFTSSGTFPMHAQVAEFSGIATVSPTDQTATAHPGVGTAAVTVTANTVDSQTGDLVVVVVQWGASVAITATASEAYNNQAAVTHAGDAGSGTQQQFSSHSFGLIPAITIAQPLGVAPWDYDSSGTNTPAVAAQASVVLAATPGKTYHCNLLEGSCLATTATAGGQAVQLLDGASVIATIQAGVQAVIGATIAVGGPGRAYKGTAGNSMTARFSAGTAGNLESVNIGAYLR